jgi:hypothetical protein
VGEPGEQMFLLFFEGGIVHKWSFYGLFLILGVLLLIFRIKKNCRKIWVPNRHLWTSPIHGPSNPNQGSKMNQKINKFHWNLQIRNSKCISRWTQDPAANSKQDPAPLNPLKNQSKKTTLKWREEKKIIIFANVFLLSKGTRKENQKINIYALIYNRREIFYVLCIYEWNIFFFYRWKIFVCSVIGNFGISAIWRLTGSLWIYSLGYWKTSSPIHSYFKG